MKQFAEERKKQGEQQGEQARRPEQQLRSAAGDESQPSTEKLCPPIIVTDKTVAGGLYKTKQSMRVSDFSAMLSLYSSSIGQGENNFISPGHNK